MMDSEDNETPSWGQRNEEIDSRDESENNTRNTAANNEQRPFAPVQWFLQTDKEWVAVIRETIVILGIAATITLTLFAISGIWPPLVSVASPSMAPNLQTGDLVFVTDEHRYSGAAAYGNTGVVTYQTGSVVGYKEFNKYGEVIIYHRNGNKQTIPIIHRARFWVNESENWYDEAKRVFLGSADNCKELANCPAEHAGFITKGDNNPVYDQVSDDPLSEPVKPSWIIGTAEFRIPWLGRIRMVVGKLLPIA